MFKLEKIMYKAARLLELPLDAALDLPLITITGAAAASIENYKNITEFSREALKIRGKGCMVKIYGDGLTIKSISASALEIAGKIDGVEIIRG